jgi:hypothetical protein
MEEVNGLRVLFTSRKLKRKIKERGRDQSSNISFKAHHQ